MKFVTYALGSSTSCLNSSLRASPSSESWWSKQTVSDSWFQCESQHVSLFEDPCLIVRQHDFLVSSFRIGCTILLIGVFFLQTNTIITKPATPKNPQTCKPFGTLQDAFSLRCVHVPWQMTWQPPQRSPANTSSISLRDLLRAQKWVPPLILITLMKKPFVTVHAVMPWTIA